MFFHGILDSADAWILNDIKSPANKFLENNHVCYFVNFRGNKYSCHLEDESDKDWENLFWNFSFDEMGRYDVPAVVDYVYQ